jgi:integrase
MISAALRHSRVVPFDVVRDGLADPHPQPIPSRDVLLTPDHVDAFVDTAYAVGGEDLGLLVELCAVTGCRPSQLIRCTRADLDVENGMLSVPPSRKGRAQGIGRKGTSILPLLEDPTRRDPSDLVARLVAFQGGPDGKLLGRVEKVPEYKGKGVKWHEGPDRVEWKEACDWRMVPEVAKRAGLPPGTTLYSLRHAKIQELLLRGIHPAIIAKALDTSVAVIDAHYGKYIGRRPEAVEQLRSGLRRRESRSPQGPA